MSKHNDNGTMFLFEGFEEKPKPKPKVVSMKDEEKKPEPPKRKIEYTKPKTFYTYDEYLKIHCGNHAAAEYWWKRLMKKK